MKHTIITAILACLGGLYACTKSIPPEEVDVVPLYDIVASLSSADEAATQAAIDSFGSELSALVAVVSGEPMNADVVQAWANSQAVAVFTPLVDSLYQGRSCADALGHILANAKHEGLALPRRQYAEVVYGRPESMVFVDTVMLVALNHYLGADFDGYSHLPDYMRRVKTPQMLPYDLAEALVATSYPCRETPDATVASRLIYEGALAMARMRLVPDADEATALGYTPEQYKQLKANEKTLWQTLIQRQLLFDTAESTAQRLVAPSPATTDLGSNVPGRAGRFIGYRMICSYLAQPDADTTSLAILLSPAFYAAPTALQTIRYNP